MIDRAIEGITQPGDCAIRCQDTPGRETITFAVFFLILYAPQVAKHGLGDAIITTVG